MIRYKIYRSLFMLFVVCSFATISFAQTVVYSDPTEEDGRIINFEIIGKMNGNFLFLTATKRNYSIDLYDANMKVVNKTALDFMPDKVLKTNLIVYPDFFYLIYQYQQKSIAYCMAAKFNAKGKLLADPVELDTTKVDWAGETSIYTVLNSDDRSKIMLVKILQKKGKFFFATKLLNDKLQLQHAGRLAIDVDDRKSTISDFLLDNDGVLVFTKASRTGNKENISKLELITKLPEADSFKLKDIALKGNYLDEIKLKIDNYNRHYIINSFYYDEKQRSIDGLFCAILNIQPDSTITSVFIPFTESLKQTAKTTGNTKEAFDNFFIKNIIVKKDGGYLLVAEDYSSQTNSYNSNPWNRWDYLYGSPYGGFYPSYYYNPYTYWYRPYGSYNDQSSTRYFYSNVLLLSVDSTGAQQWNNVLRKDQSADNDESYLSFFAGTINGEIHFLYNDITRRSTLLQESTSTPDGIMNKTPLLRGLNNDYEFMPKFGKQVGARQVIIPCTYRNNICFAKIDY